MIKKPSHIRTKIILILSFFAGFCMMCNIAFAFEETEMIEGIVEHTYTSGAHGGKPAGGTIAETPMCRVVWYDKDGEKVTYGMPNDMGYEVGDSYFLEVDVETNRIPKRSVAECVVAAVIGLIICTVVVILWISKFGKSRQPKPQKRLSALEQKRRETYNPEQYVPVIRCSICTGEQVAGFKDKSTGKFTEIMLIQNEKDLKKFKERYGVENVVKEY